MSKWPERCTNCFVRPEHQGQLKEKLAKNVYCERIRGFGMKFFSQFVAATCLMGSGFGLCTSTQAAASTANSVDFQKEIRPLFESRCFECHGPKKQKSGLRLDRKSSAFQGGDSGKPAIVPGKSAESVLLQKITSKDPDEVMPPKGAKLTAAETDLLKKW